MDTLLASLQLGPEGVFNLARNLLSVSIRDQMVRAAMVAQALPFWLDAQYKDAARTKPVLVVGAGACGMTLAIGLARRGIRVDVVEPKDKPFDLQRYCTSRWLDSVQYDWPMDHCWSEQFPWEPQVHRMRRLIPFPCPAGPASTLVEQHWDRDLEGYLQGPLGEYLAFHWGRRLRNYPSRISDSPWLVAYIKDDLRHRVVYRGTYSAVLIAFGFGAETSTIEAPSHFVGYRFWETDLFEDPTYGNRIREGEDKVVISGGGDGGLQDFLRIMTRKPSARAIFHDLRLMSRSPRIDLIHSLENRTERAAAWANGKFSDYPFRHAPYLAERHHAIQREVDRLLDDASFHHEVISYLSRRPRMTHLISESKHFGCLYGLNLFLATLLVRALKRSDDPTIRGSLRVLAGRKIVAIDSPDPRSIRPPLSAADCIGRDWDVRLEQISTPIRANVVIIRHGLRPTFEDIPRLEPSDIRPRPMPPTHLHEPDEFGSGGRRS